MLSSIGSVLLIIAGFGMLIFIHELGHFLAAKWAGIRTEAFAVGMGPVMVSWRKGIGLVFGSTDAKVKALTGQSASTLSEETLARHGVGETEYSLRWLPIGGFVKMLGQEDANPNAISSDPRSYGMRPIGKRMIVVSAGVVMNLLLALILFVIAFMVGVKFVSSTIGSVAETGPAGIVKASNAAELGVTEPGLKSGDRILTVDGDAATTFADIQIATAMGRLDVPIRFEVDRPGVEGTLHFEITPTKGRELLTIGVAPAISAELAAGGVAERIDEILQQWFPETAIRAGMRLIEANGQPVHQLDDYKVVADASDGQSIETQWQAFDETGTPFGPVVSQSVEPVPVFARVDAGDGDAVRSLLGFVPLSTLINTADSANADVLNDGDVVLRAGDVDWPRFSDLRAVAQNAAGGELDLRVRRGNQTIDIEVKVNREGMLGVSIVPDVVGAPVTALPLASEQITTIGEGEPTKELRPLPISSFELPAGTQILRVNGHAVGFWGDVRGQLVAASSEAVAQGSPVDVVLEVKLPTAESIVETITIQLDVARAEEILARGWSSHIHQLEISGAFEPVYVVRSAEGNPLLAVRMGFDETMKMLTLTYLTIDRLVRGTVGVDQLRGPVGIIDLGTQVLPRGFMYFLFLLGMISVNLAVINFLPLPIVDGGLFLFLLYEKLKGRPPSIAFQNAATILGLCLIGTLFVITFYNDIMRLVG